MTALKSGNKTRAVPSTEDGRRGTQEAVKMVSTSPCVEALVEASTSFLSLAVGLKDALQGDHPQQESSQKEAAQQHAQQYASEQQDVTQQDPPQKDATQQDPPQEDATQKDACYILV
ncbi:MAG: hypothetical protein Q9223_005765 [Gallowayella weberi]